MTTQRETLEYIARHSSTYHVSANGNTVNRYNPAISVCQDSAELPRTGKGRFRPILKTWQTQATRLVELGLVESLGSGTYRITVLGAAKLGIDLKAAMLQAAYTEYTRVREMHSEVRHSWLSWLDYKRYATNKRVVSDTMMNRYEKTDFCWVRFEGYNRLGNKVSFLSPRTSLDNWQIYESELQTLERLLTCLESGIDISRV